MLAIRPRIAGTDHTLQFDLTVEERLLPWITAHGGCSLI